MLFFKYFIYFFYILNLVSAIFPSPPTHQELIALTNLFNLKSIGRSNQPSETVISRLGSKFLPKNTDIKIIIHGWNAHRDHIAVTPIRDAYLAKGHDGLFMADWGAASRILYFDSRYFVKPVGMKLAKIIEKFFIRKQKIDPSNIHIIGHSLGAHIAGNIGKYFNGTIGRITALDPAGPLFEQFVKDGLLSKHAQFVDCIHTDSPILGQSLQRGHADFYPNYGKFGQPGCEILDIITGTACSHYKASLFYAESVQSPNSFPSFPCQFQNILRKDCNTANVKNLVVMGENVSRSAKGTYFLQTNRGRPFGKGMSPSLYSRLLNDSNSSGNIVTRPVRSSTNKSTEKMSQHTTSIPIKKNVKKTVTETSLQSYTDINETTEAYEETTIQNSADINENTETYEGTTIEEFPMETISETAFELSNVKNRVKV